MPNYLKMPRKSQVFALLELGWIYRRIEAETKGKQGRPLRCVSRGLRAILIRSTYARHKIRHGIRHTTARTGRCLRPSVANDRLRHMPIDSARVLKADGSQSLEVPAERGAVLRRAAEEFEQRVFLSTLNDIRNFCEAYGIEEPRSKSRASGIPRVFKFLVTMDVADVERMLDDRMFSGPAQLGPIADAIRGKAKEYRDAAIDHS